MSLTGKPPQDLSLSNLAVKDTLVATQTTAININAVTINGISTDTTLQPIRSVFTGAEIGQWSVSSGVETFSIQGQLNQSGVDQPANAVLAQIDNYPPQAAVTFSGFLYCPDAATINTAGFLINLTVSTSGEVSSDGVVGKKDVAGVDYRRGHPMPIN